MNWKAVMCLQSLMNVVVSQDDATATEEDEEDYEEEDLFDAEENQLPPGWLGRAVPSPVVTQLLHFS